MEGLVHYSCPFQVKHRVKLLDTRITDTLNPAVVFPFPSRILTLYVRYIFCQPPDELISLLVKLIVESRSEKNLEVVHDDSSVFHRSELHGVELMVKVAKFFIDFPPKSAPLHINMVLDNVMFDLSEIEIVYATYAVEMQPQAAFHTCVSVRAAEVGSVVQAVIKIKKALLEFG